jgi:uncharacterized membrane protein
MLRSSSTLTLLFGGLLILFSFAVVTSGCSKAKEEKKPRESVVQDMEIKPDGGDEAKEDSHTKEK